MIGWPWNVSKSRNNTIWKCLYCIRCLVLMLVLKIAPFYTKTRSWTLTKTISKAKRPYFSCKFSARHIQFLFFCREHLGRSLGEKDNLQNRRRRLFQQYSHLRSLKFLSESNVSMIAPLYNIGIYLWDIVILSSLCSIKTWSKWERKKVLEIIFHYEEINDVLKFPFSIGWIQNNICIGPKHIACQCHTRPMTHSITSLFHICQETFLTALLQLLNLVGWSNILLSVSQSVRYTNGPYKWVKTHDTLFPVPMAMLRQIFDLLGNEQVSVWILLFQLTLIEYIMELSWC